MSAAVALCAILSTTIIISLAQSRTEQLGQSQAKQLIEALADESSYSVLIAHEQADVAEKTLEGIARRPEVLYAQLTHARGEHIASIGDPSLALKGQDVLAFIQHAPDRAQIQRRRSHWDLVAPVRVKSVVQVEPQQSPTTIGYLYVVWSRAQYASLNRSISAVSVFAAFIALLVGFAWAIRRSHRLTAPLVHLSRTMENANADESVRATSNGTREFDRMSAAFNALMERLGQHRGTLEQTVAERTANLSEARDAAQAAERFKSALMAAVSHEMKTPLHAIEAYIRDAIHELEFCEDDVSATATRTALAAALIQKEQLHSLINQVLDYARAKAGRHTLNFVVVEIQTIFQRMHGLFSPVAKASGNSLSFTSAGRDFLISDPDKLNVIINNLLSNACAHTENGSIALHIESTPAEATIKVRDTGHGIPSHLIERVWDEFQQADMGERRRAGGTGLGLAVTKSLVELLGGRASIHSTVGCGTEVAIHLPVRSADLVPTRTLSHREEELC